MSCYQVLSKILDS